MAIAYNKKCPYCRGKNLYIRRTSPMLVLGCKDCEAKAKLMEKSGMQKSDILKVLRR